MKERLLDGDDRDAGSVTDASVDLEHMIVEGKLERTPETPEEGKRRRSDQEKVERVIFLGGGIFVGLSGEQYG